MLKPVRKINATEENFRLETRGGFAVPRRDPVQPVPVGSYVVRVFRVTGYDPDCDGSLMARLAAVDSKGEVTGWEVNSVGLHSDTTLQVDHPSELWTKR